MRALLRYIRRTAPGWHLLSDDFNTLAPGDRASLAQAPLWVKAQTWFQLGNTPRWTLGVLLDAGYVDCFRKLHPDEDGLTLPSVDPQVRLDYVFAAPSLADALRECRVITPILLMPAPHRFEIPGDGSAAPLIDGLRGLGRQVITFDPPDSGNSTRPRPLSMSEMREDADEAES